MKTSQLFSKTRKSHPADETSKNAQLLIRAGYIHKESAGVYDWLPLGKKTLDKITGIIREEMNSLGAHELLMSTLQRPELWKTTNRWDSQAVDVWFKSAYASGKEVGLAWSHEEPIVDMMRSFVASYRDLPVAVYQFQNKLRNELRAKSGIMRCREFVMKDMYSLSASEEEHQKFYDTVIEAYNRVFERLGLGDKTYLTFASGGAFAEFSHEFQTLTPAGEDVIYLHEGRKLAINKEVLNDQVLTKLGLSKDELVEHKAAEVGNIFSFGTNKSESLGLKFVDQAGHEKFVVLGSYGIGPGRVMGVITELFADDKGLVWPDEVSPFRVYLTCLGNDSQTLEATNSLYQELVKAQIEVLFNDTDASSGEKLADADLLGSPFRLVVSQRSLEAGGAEIKKRHETDTKVVAFDQLVSLLAMPAKS